MPTKRQCGSDSIGSYSKLIGYMCSAGEGTDTNCNAGKCVEVDRGITRCDAAGCDAATGSCKTQTAPRTEKCSDGTPVGQCSASKPARCYANPGSNPYFRDDCGFPGGTSCGCPEDKVCTITGACEPRTAGKENCLKDTSTIKKCITRGSFEYLATYGKGCRDFGVPSDNCQSGHCDYVRVISQEFCEAGCDSSTNPPSCKLKPAAPPTPPRPSCVNDYHGNCKTVCFPNTEDDRGVADCSQAGPTGGTICCVPKSVPQNCGAEGQACCSADSCDPNLECRQGVLGKTCQKKTLPLCYSLPNGACRAGGCLQGEKPLQGTCPAGGVSGGGVCCEINPAQFPDMKCVSGTDEARVGECLAGKPPLFCGVSGSHAQFISNCFICGCKANENCGPLGQCHPQINNALFTGEGASPGEYQYSK